jgi:basic membrane protein A
MSSKPTAQAKPYRNAYRLLSSAALLTSGALLLTACGGTSSASQADTSTTNATLVSTQPINDKGVVQDLVGGFRQQTKKDNIQSNVVVLKDPSTYVSALSRVASRNDFVLTTFPPMIKAVSQVAPQHPQVKFVLLDAKLPKSQPNVEELFFKENQSSYLAGVVAGAMTKTNKVGFLGSLHQDVINRYLVGYYYGVHAENPNAKVCSAFIGKTNDPALGKQYAVTMYHQGIDIIHAAASGTEQGIYQASEKLHKYLIGADVDIRPFDPKYGLTAAGPDFSEASKLVVKQFNNGNFKPGFHSYGLKKGLVKLYPFNQHLVPQPVQQKVAKAKQAIIDGNVTVPGAKAVSKLKNCS